MAYKRLFIPLANEAAGYEFKGRKPAGRCVILVQDGTEKITVTAQDMRPQTHYALYAIFAEKGKFAGVNIAPMHADENGRAEISCTVKCEKLHSHSLADVRAVAVMDTCVPHIQAVLCGYNGEATTWKHGYFEKTEPVKETPKPPKPSPPAKPKKKPLEPAPITTVAEEPPPPPLPVKEPSPPPLPAEESPPPPPPPAAEPFTPLPYLTSDIFNALPPFTPFAGGAHENAGIRWARFAHTDEICSPPDAPSLIVTPFFAESYEHYAHFILGAVSEGDTTEYVLGVPGVYDKTTFQQANALGFAEFKSYDGSRPEDNAFGYWLLYIS